MVKEANVYARAGYKVTVYGLWYDEKLLEMDQLLLEPSITYKAGVNLLDTNRLKSKKIRMQRMLGRYFVKYTGIQNTSALGYDFKKYLNKLVIESADLYIGHEEMSLALGKALIKIGKKVAFDFEDWHSKDLLSQDRAYRPIKLLEHLEHYILHHALYCYTTSDAMATALSDYYRAPKPEVIYNSFLASQRESMDGKYKDVEHHRCPSIYWFSQVIGPGRGLELLFESLSLVQTPFQLHLRGIIAKNFHEQLIAKIPEHVELYIHDLVSPEELISRIAEHDLAIAFEETKPENKYYTISNKIFHYLQSGVAVLATETAGQKEVAQKSPDGIKIVKRHPGEIAKVLDALLNNREELKRMKDASWNVGSFVFSFEQMEYKLLNQVQTQILS